MAGGAGSNQVNPVGPFVDAEKGREDAGPGTSKISHDTNECT